MKRYLAAGWRFGATPALIIMLTLLTTAGAAAHAFLDQSTPAANSILPQPPPDVRMRFTEPLEPRYSQAELFDTDGNKVQTEPSRVADDPYELILPLPGSLARGTYTVQWRNVSTADGHPEVGFFAFTIGTQADVAAPSPPQLPEPSEAAGTLGTIGRWLSLLGIAAAVGGAVVWQFVIRPAVSQVEAHRARVSRRVRWFGLGGVLSAILGGLILLAAQAIETGDFWGTASASRFGQLVVLRLALLLVFGLVLTRDEAWASGQPLGKLALALGAAALLPYSLVSHAAAQAVGKTAAITVDWIHLGAASVWVGGLATLLIGLVLARGLPADDRRRLYAEVISRFTTLAIASVIVLTLSGFYAAWLLVGNLDGLRETDYGRTLAVKLALIVPLLALGAINQLIIGPSMLRRAQSRLRFSRAVLAEVVLGVAVLLVVGVLISLPPARDVLASTSGHPSATFNQEGLYVTLHVTPGVVGKNLYTVDVRPIGATLSPGTEVLVRVSRSDAIEGQREIALNQVPGTTRFEAEGSELSIVGTWQGEVIVRQPNTADWRARTTLQIARAATVGKTPSPPPYFLGITAAVGVLSLGLAIVLVVSGLRSPRKRENQRFVVEAGTALAVIGIVVLLLSRGSGGTEAAGESNPVPRTAASVATGREHFQHLCASCHGEDGRGDGPSAAGLIPPPADLHAAHVDDHADRQLYLWIRDGINNSAMPGFKEDLTEQQIWDLVNYVRSLRHPVEAARP